MRMISLSPVCPQSALRRGEFGRSPVIQTKGPPGRLHWPGCFSAIAAGCGIRGGALYGESDKTGSAPVSNPVTPQDLHATETGFVSSFLSQHLALDSNSAQ